MINRDRIKAFLTLLPSMILIAVFVYGFIGNTFWLSLTDWGGVAALAENPVRNYAGLSNYKELFTGFLGGGFRQDLVNAVYEDAFPWESIEIRQPLRSWLRERLPG